MDHPIGHLMQTTLENIKDMVDVNTVVGEPIAAGNGATIIPISKVSFGFASGGSDFPSASPKEMFGGGSGGGVTIQPMAFLVIKGESVRMIQVADKDNIPERLANMVPDAIDTVSSLIGGRKKGAEKQTVVEETKPEKPAEKKPEKANPSEKAQ